jgi:hypothetical protein
MLKIQYSRELRNSLKLMPAISAKQFVERLNNWPLIPPLRITMSKSLKVALPFGLGVRGKFMKYKTTA